MLNVVLHPWNEDPLPPPPRYRLVVVHQRNRDNKIVAQSLSRDALLGLAEQFRILDYDFVRLERLE